MTTKRLLSTYRFDNVEALLIINSAKHNMLVVQPLGLDSGDEELSSIGVGSRVSHGEETRRPVLHQEVLIIEAATINTGSTCTIKILKVSALKTTIIKQSDQLHLQT